MYLLLFYVNNSLRFFFIMSLIDTYYNINGIATKLSNVLTHNSQNT